MNWLIAALYVACALVAHCDAHDERARRVQAEWLSRKAAAGWTAEVADLRRELKAERAALQPARLEALSRVGDCP